MKKTVALELILTKNKKKSVLNEITPVSMIRKSV